MLEMERRDYAQLTAQRLSTQYTATQPHSNKPQHLRGALASTTSAAAAPVSRESSTYSYESYLASSMAICALEAVKDSDTEDLIADVAEGGAVDDDQVALALALSTMDQIEDDEEGIVAAVDYRFVKFYSSRFSVCLRIREILQ